MIDKNIKVVFDKEGKIAVAVIIVVIIISLFINRDANTTPTPTGASKPISAPAVIAPADLFKNGLSDIEKNHFSDAIYKLKKIPSNTPEYVEAAKLIKKAEGLLKKQESEQKRANEAHSLTLVEQRVKQVKEKLGKYYATKEDVSSLFTNVVALKITEDVYKNSAEPSDRKFAVKLSAVITKAEAVMREAHASALEEAFISTGMDARVSAMGSNKSTLRVKYVLMSQPLVYKLQRDGLVSVRANELGYKKVLYTDGYDNTWTVDLR